MYEIITRDNGNPKDWERVLLTIVLPMNSLINQATGFSPFYLDYGYEHVIPIQALKPNENIETYSVPYFVRSIISDWGISKESFQKSINLQAKYYNRKDRDVYSEIGDLVVFPTRNLRIKKIPEKMKKRLVRPLQVDQKNWGTSI